LNEDKEIWDSALSAASEGHSSSPDRGNHKSQGNKQSRQGGKKILMATSSGAYMPGTTLESLLAVALTLRGADVEILLCDKALPACLSCWIDWHPDQRKFAEFGPSKELCDSCFASAHKMYSSLGLKVNRYSEHLTQDDLDEAEKISSTLPVSEIESYTYEGMAVGEHALAGTLRYYSRGDLSNEPQSEPILRRYLKASLLTTFAVQNLLRKTDYDSAVFHHGIYVPQGLVGEACRKAGVKVVNWNPAYRNKCFIFSHYDTYHHTMMSEPVESWVDMEWNDERDAELMDYLKSRWKGTQDWIWFHENPMFELQDIARELGVDFSKPCIGLLTSVMWDAKLHYPSNAFPDMLDWVLKTIEYFVKRPDVQLIIRVHPAEVHGMLPARQKMADEIRKVYPNLPKNIIVIPPESEVSTYAVMSQCSTVIIYNTKTGVELTANGMPVIVAGEAWIRNKGFAIDAADPGEYYEILDRLPFNGKMSPEDTLRAKKYAYHFFFRRMIPLAFMEPVKDDPPFRIRIKSIKDLMDRKDRGLDVICRGILEGEAFIYDSEPKPENDGSLIT
jgi:hypothetical protein